MKNEKKPNQFNAADIVKGIKASSPKALDKIDDPQAVRLVRLALQQIAQQIGATEAGSVKVAGLGSFRVRQVTREREGQEAVNARRVRFMAAGGGRKKAKKASNDDAMAAAEEA